MSKILYIGAAPVSYEEKGQAVYLVVTAVAYAAYVFMVLGAADGGPLQGVDYVPIMLWTIGLAIAAMIIGRIGVEVVGRVDSEIHKTGEGLTSDIRDREIDRYGEYIGGILLGIGMVVPFILAITRADHFWIANAMYLVFVVAGVLSATSKLVAYRRGF